RAVRSRGVPAAVPVLLPLPAQERRGVLLREPRGDRTAPRDAGGAGERRGGRDRAGRGRGRVRAGAVRDDARARGVVPRERRAARRGRGADGVRPDGPDVRRRAQRRRPGPRRDGEVDRGRSPARRGHGPCGRHGRPGPRRPRRHVRRQPRRVRGRARGPRRLPGGAPRGARRRARRADAGTAPRVAVPLPLDRRRARRRRHAGDGARRARRRARRGAGRRGAARGDRARPPPHDRGHVRQRRSPPDAALHPVRRPRRGVRGPRRGARGRRSPPMSSAVVQRLPAAGGRPAVTYRHAGDRFLLLEYGDMVLDLTTNFRVFGLHEALARDPIPGVIETVPALRSMLVHYDGRTLSPRRLVDALVAREEHLPAVADLVIPSRRVTLPIAFVDRWTRADIERYVKLVRKDAPNVIDGHNAEYIARYNGLRDVEEMIDTICRTA